jgi:hypothetical protein
MGQGVTTMGTHGRAGTSHFPPLPLDFRGPPSSRSPGGGIRPGVGGVGGGGAGMKGLPWRSHPSIPPGWLFPSPVASSLEGCDGDCGGERLAATCVSRYLPWATED